MKAIVVVSTLMIAVAGLATACAPAQKAAAQSVPTEHLAAGEWFKQKGCTDCHSISAYRMWNIAAQGPDLSEAVADVPKRFGVPLEQFLRAPTGTMAMVLSSRIPLTPDERDIAIQKLHDAYRRHQGLPDAIRPRASH